MAKGQPPAGLLGGEDIRGAFAAATLCLERQKDAINALNVFPVPDGDTGTNMLLTMRSVNQECVDCPEFSADAIASAMAHGALLGARGNSGVILSQFFNGLAQGLHGKYEFDGEDLAKAFGLASRAAYGSVGKPVDGTMLTVLRELSLAASDYVECRRGYRDVLSVWAAALEAAKTALSRTPMQLPVLREAGVVDAGGQGVVTLLEGAWRHLNGEEVADQQLELCAPVLSDRAEAVTAGHHSGAHGSVQQEYLAATEDDLYGYCTQLLIHGEGLSVEDIREQLSSMAGSTVVVGDGRLVKVHAHTDDPGQIISYAVGLGTIAQVSIDNMDEQHQEFVAMHRTPSSQGSEAADASTPATVAGATVGVVAVGWGDGIARLFEGLGCARVVAGGQTMNPSTQDLLNAALSLGTAEVILLPNNSNIIPAARQAATLSNGASLHIVPSKTIPQGVAALLAYNPENESRSNLVAMESALETVKTLEVTRAVRPTTIDGLNVEEGQYIGLLEGELAAAGESALDALRQTLVNLGPSRGQLLTLYWGSDIDEGGASEAGANLKTSFDGLDVEVVHGGQPLYQFIASLE